ncbi:MAG: BTAD domain-containing putative transcriptional regulator [Pseudomonadota bacterium]
MLARRDGEAVELPRSRKARALLAYLALAPAGIRKEEACQLLFASADDPRGSLRWCLSRLRAALGGGADSYIVSGKKLQLSDRVRTDVSRLSRARRGSASLEELVSLDADIDGVFLEDLELDECPEFEAWLFAMRSRCGADHAALLVRVIEASAGEATAIEHARRLVSVNGDSEDAWAVLITALRRSGNVREARAVYETAHRELRRERVPLSGLLRKAIDVAGPMPAPAIDPPSSVTSIAGPSAWQRPLLRVHRMELGSGLTESLGRELDAAIYSAATRYKGCSTIATDLLPSHAGTEGPTGDLRLHSRARKTSAGVLLDVNLLVGESGASLYGWQLLLDDADEIAAAEQVTAYFCNHFEVDLTVGMVAHALEKSEERRTVQDLYLLTLPQIYSAEGYDPEKVLRSLEAVLRIDPGFGPALCTLSWVRNTLKTYNSDPGELSVTSSLARRSVEFSQDDPFVLGWASIVIAHADRDIRLGQDLVNRALSFNPYSPMALLAGGFMAHYEGEDDRADQMIDRLEAHGLSGPMDFLCLSCRAMIRYQQGRFGEAEEIARRALGHNPTFILPLRIRAASLAKLGRLSEAREVAELMVELDPSEHLSFFTEYSPYVSTASVEALCDGLRQAGLPE